MRTLTFIRTDTPQVRGPYTFARLRELWSAGEIVADSKLFLTQRDEADRGKCFGLRAADIEENVEGGMDIDVSSLCARVTALVRRSELITRDA